MRWSDIPRTPSNRTLRQFAGLWIVFFSAMAVRWAFVPGREVLATVLAVLAATVGPLGLRAPQAIRPLFVGWMMLVFPIGWLVSHVILALLLYGLFTPLGLVFKLIGRDALARRRVTKQSTYWVAKPQARNVRQYFRQF